MNLMNIQSTKHLCHMDQKLNWREREREKRKKKKKKAEEERIPRLEHFYSTSFHFQFAVFKESPASIFPFLFISFNYTLLTIIPFFCITSLSKLNPQQPHLFFSPFISLFPYFFFLLGLEVTGGVIYLLSNRLCLDKYWLSFVFFQTFIFFKELQNRMQFVRRKLDRETFHRCSNVMG